MDYAIMDATIAKLDKKPPLWITRQNVIRELDDLTNKYISECFSGSSRNFVYRELCEKKNKGEYDDCLTTSPFWRLRMGDRTYWPCWDGRHLRFNNIKHLHFNNINEKVRCDYYNALCEGNMLFPAQIPMVIEYRKKNEYETKNNMWKAVQHETILGLYGKICDDVLNEILSFC